MKKIDHYVKVYTGGAIDVPSIGLVSGVCTWTTGGDILTDRWCSTIGSSVDISLGGNYSRYSSVTVTILKSSIVRETLQNYGLKLENSRLEIFATDGFTTEMKWRGVISDIDEQENTVSLEVSHVANYYSVDITPSVGGDKLPVVFGDSVDNVKCVVVENEKYEDLTIGDGLLPVFVVCGGTYNTGIDFNQTQSTIWIRSVYNVDLVSTSAINSFINAQEFVKITGKESLVGTLTISGATTINVGGKVYLAFKFLPIPMNAKNIEGWFFPEGSELVMEKTTYKKIYYPYGTDITKAKLVYKSGDKYRPFPTYLDSRKDYDDHFEVLDADGQGFAHSVPVTSSIIFRNGGESGTPYILHDGDNDVGANFSVFVTNIDNLISNLGTRTRIRVSSTGMGGAPFEIYLLQTVRAKNGAIPDNLFDTKLIRISTTQSNDYTRRVRSSVLTPLITGSTSVGIYNDTGTVTFNGNNSSDYFNCLFPQAPNDSSYNAAYRIGTTGNGNGTAHDAYSKVENDWEKIAFVTAQTFITYSDWGGASVNTIDIGQMLTEPCDYGDAYLQGAVGRKDELGEVISTTHNAYLATLKLQNYGSLGKTTPAKGWGLDYIADYSGAIGTFLLGQMPIVYNTDKSNSRDIKYDMLKYSGSIGYIDSEGKENAKRIVFDSAPKISFDKSMIIGKPKKENMDSQRVYTDVSISYSSGKISIRNTEATTFSAEYVDGCTGNDAFRLWSAGHSIYKRYGSKNEIPKGITDVTGIQNAVSAIQYIERLYKLSGIIFENDTDSNLYERFKVSFVTSSEYIFGTGLTIGDPIEFSYPHQATGATGMITEVTTNPLSGEVFIVAECIGAMIESTTAIEYIETGSADEIIESGSQPITIMEL